MLYWKEFSVFHPSKLSEARPESERKTEARDIICFSWNLFDSKPIYLYWKKFTMHYDLPTDVAIAMLNMSNDQHRPYSVATGVALLQQSNSSNSHIQNRTISPHLRASVSIRSNKLVSVKFIRDLQASNFFFLRSSFAMSASFPRRLMSNCEPEVVMRLP